MLRTLCSQVFVEQGTTSTEQFPGLDSPEKTHQQSASSGKLGLGQGVEQRCWCQRKKWIFPSTSGVTVTKMHVQNAQSLTIMPWTDNTSTVNWKSTPMQRSKHCKIEVVNKQLQKVKLMRAPVQTLLRKAKARQKCLRSHSLAVTCKPVGISRRK